MSTRAWLAALLVCAASAPGIACAPSTSGAPDETPELDGGVLDDSDVDASVQPDAGEPDAGALDGGAADAGHLDAGELARVPLVYVLHDQETAVYNHRPRQLDGAGGLLDTMSYPEVVPLAFRDYINLTEAWQWFWFDQLMLSKYGHTNLSSLPQAEQDDMKRAWRDLTRGWTAFTNGRGTEANHDYISGTNVAAGLPGLSQLTCGGNVLELFDTTPVTAYGSLMYKVKVLDGSKPPPDPHQVNFRTAPAILNRATSVTPNGFDGGFSPKHGPWRVEDFPFMGGTPMYFPVASKGGAKSERGHDPRGFDWVVELISAQRVRVVLPGEPIPEVTVP